MMKMAVVSLAALAALTFGCAAQVGTGDPSTDEGNVGTQGSALTGDDKGDDNGDKGDDKSDKGDDKDDDDSKGDDNGKGCEKGHKGKDDHANKCGPSTPVVSV